MIYILFFLCLVGVFAIGYIMGLAEERCRSDRRMERQRVEMNKIRLELGRAKSVIRYYERGGR